MLLERVGAHVIREVLRKCHGDKWVGVLGALSCLVPRHCRIVLDLLQSRDQFEVVWPIGLKSRIEELLGFGKTWPDVAFVCREFCRRFH